MKRFIKPSFVGVLTPDSINDKNDCSVRAIANAYNISYEEAHKNCAEFGRKNKDGMYCRDMNRLINFKGHSYLIQFKGTTYPDYGGLKHKGTSLRNFIKSYAEGTWLVMITGHFLVVKNGRIFDKGLCQSRSHVIYAWRIS